MAKITLQYGQKIFFPTHLLQYLFAGIGIAGGEVVMKEFIIDKYFKDDTDPNRYKVKLIPIDQSGIVPIESVYSSDLINMIKRNQASFITE